MTPRATVSRERTGDGIIWSVNLKSAQVLMAFILMCVTFASTLYGAARLVVVPIVREEIAKADVEKTAWGKDEHAALRAEIRERVDAASRLEQDRYSEILRRLNYLQARLDRMTDK